MKIHGIDFGPIWGMSGIMNFYGQGWPYHKLLKIFGINLKDITLVSKTVTLHPREGNMPLREDLMPAELVPRSVHFNFLRKHALNSVSLSGPGAEVILSARELKEKTEPFQLSFMSVARTSEERLKEFDQFIKILLREYPNYQTPVGLQLNITCPNTEHDNPEREEIIQMLNRCGVLAGSGIAIILKISVEMPVENVLIFGRHINCHAICTSNTVQFGKLPKKINWQKLFPHGSPLGKRNLSVPGAGGLSGAPLLPLVLEQVKELRQKGFEKHINAGGGILYPRDVDALKAAGADSVSIGSVFFLNPLAIPRIIQRAKEIFS